MTENNVTDFLEWKQGLNTVVLGKKTMYDVKGYHKYLDESELWGYWSEKVKNTIMKPKDNTQKEVYTFDLTQAYKDFYDKYGF